MKKAAIIFTVLFLFISFSSSYAGKRRDRTLQYQANNENTGAIKINPSFPIAKVKIDIDGNPVWHKGKGIKSLTVMNVPLGKHTIHFYTSDWQFKEQINYTDSVNIKSINDTQTMSVIIPQRHLSTKFWIVDIVSAAILMACFLVPAQ